MKRAICAVTILTLIGATYLFAATQTSPLRVAVILADAPDDLSEPAIAVTEAALSAQRDFSLVERSEIRRVFQEQRLSAAGLVDSASMVRLGELLHANILLLLEVRALPSADSSSREQPATTSERICRIRAVEARTGIILESRFIEEKMLEQYGGLPLRVVRAALKKYEVPPKERRYVGLLDFRSEELDNSLTNLCDALRVLLVHDLSSMPNMILLERERMEELGRESRLTGLNLDLRDSMVLLDGSARRGKSGDEVIITVKMGSPGKDHPDKVSVTGAPSDLPGLRRKITEAVYERMRVEPAEARILDPMSEASVFKERAIEEAAFNSEGAARLVEAAVALDSSRNMHGWAADMFDKLQLPPDWIHIQLNLMPDDELSALLTRYARNRLRAAEESYAAFKMGWPYMWFPRKLCHFLHKFGVSERLHTVLTPSAKAMLREAMTTQHREILERMEQEAADSTKPGSAMKWFELAGMNLCDSYDLLLDPEQWAAGVKEATLMLESPPFELSPDLEQAQERALLFNGLCVFLPDRPEVDWTRPLEEQVQPVVERLLKWLLERPNPLERLAVYNAMFGHRWGTADDAKAALDIILNDPALMDLPERLPKDFATLDSYTARFYAESAFSTLLRDEPETCAEYGEKILRPIIKPEYGSLLLQCNGSILDWMYSLEKINRQEEAYEILDLLDRIYAKEPVGSFSYPLVESRRSFLRPLRARLAQALNRPLPDETETAGLEFIPVLEADDEKPRRGCWAMGLDGDRLFLLRRILVSGVWRVSVTSVALPDGTEALLSEAVFPDEHRMDFEIYRTRWPTLFVTDGDGTCFAGFKSYGVIAFQDGRTDLWTVEKDLPVAEIASLAWLDGRLYIASEPGGLVEFDPATGESVTHFSSRSEQGGTALAGPPAYHIHAILSDADEKCLWMCTDGEYDFNTGWPRNALWRYYPARKELTKILEMGKSGWIQWSRNWMFAGDERRFWILDPRGGWNEEQNVVAGGRRSFPARGVIGDKLFISGNDTYLLGGGATAPIRLPRKKVADVGRFVNFSKVLEYGDDLIVSDISGNVFLVRMEGAASAFAALKASYEQRRKNPTPSPTPLLYGAPAAQ
jgi:hypothetical protein